MSDARKSVVPDLLGVHLQGSSERFTIVGNAHTARGRFSVLSPTGEGRSVSARDIISAEPAAQAWIDGFLHGAEVEPPDFDPAADGLWRAAMDSFLAKGDIPWADEATVAGVVERLVARAATIASQRDFADFLRLAAYESRVGLDRWNTVPVEYFLNAWAGALDPESADRNYGYSGAVALEADWADLARSVLDALI